jgi:secreted trypsin-like serine protease
MKSITTLMLTLSTVAMTGCQANTAWETTWESKEILGGTTVGARDTIAASTVALRAGGALCTASLVANDLAITAAHCVTGGVSVSQMRIVFGASTSAPIAVARVTGAVTTRIWGTVEDEDAPDHGDIAMVRFSGGLPAGFRPARILWDTSVLQDGGTATLAGYGITRTHPHTGSGRLRKVDVEIANATHGETEILFDQRDGRGACHGDSGGPAFAEVDGELLLFGVTNRGFDDDGDTCARFGVYTKIAAYREWVQAAVRALRAG